MAESLLRLSQSHLTLLATCPPQFQLRHLAQAVMPPSLERQTQTEWGSQFHILMQQKLLGLPMPLAEPDRSLAEAIACLSEALPELWQTNPNRWQEAEHSRTLLFQDYLLLAIYDLLVIEAHQAQILDWKTYSQPRKSAELANHWQTRLYLYILAETTDFRPEQLAMTYWFVPPSRSPQSLTFPYNRDLHERTHADLSHLLSQLDDWLSDRDMGFPHRVDCQTACPFAERDSSSAELLDWQDFLNSIPEMATY